MLLFLILKMQKKLSLEKLSLETWKLKHFDSVTSVSWTFTLISHQLFELSKAICKILFYSEPWSRPFLRLSFPDPLVAAA